MGVITFAGHIQVFLIVQDLDNFLWQLIFDINRRSLILYCTIYRFWEHKSKNSNINKQVSWCPSNFGNCCLVYF